MIKNTFFDSLAIADSERIHTQTLYWILNLSENIFSNNEKARFLNSLFSLNGKIKITSDIMIGTEIKKIDLLIKTDNYVIVIENKLKSSEHDYQTEKYYNDIPEEYSIGVSKVCGFVSLINETAGHKAWHSIPFEKLLACLKDIKWSDNKAKELIFVEEYIATVLNLVFAFNTFIADPKSFENVFRDGSKTKYNKLKHENSINDYIRINQLETIFQKAYLKKIILELNELHCYVGETRGSALIQINVHHFEYQKRKFNVGFQFQNGTLKINVSVEGVATSRASQIDQNLIWHFENSFYRINGYNRFNKPKKKAYMSVTKQLKRDIHLLETTELTHLFKTELDLLKVNAHEFYNTLKNHEITESSIPA